jgi:hypothetical protein
MDRQSTYTTEKLRLCGFCWEFFINSTGTDLEFAREDLRTWSTSVLVAGTCLPDTSKTFCRCANISFVISCVPSTIEMKNQWEGISRHG